METINYHIDDFTEDSYKRILQKAKDSYSFESFGTVTTRRHALWRHDVDFSIQRSLRLAQIEAEEGVKATYFIHLHNEFYHFMEPIIKEKIVEILSLGHDLGLHFDTMFYPGMKNQIELEKNLAFERHILETVFSAPVNAFSFHNPDVSDALEYNSDIMAGMINTYGASIKERYTYCSDSNGYWRHQRLPDLIDAAIPDYIHILTHPCWWMPEAMMPRERIERCIQGRSMAVSRNYDNFLKEKGRINVRS